MLNSSCLDGWRRIARAVAILAAGLAGLASARAATFTVTTTNHTGAGSLRQAILDANALPGPDIIGFNIVSSGLGIIPTNALPPVTDSVVIDGTTQTGFGGSPIIELNGQSAGTGVDGLRLWAGNSTVRGLVINRFNGDGIEIATNGNNIIEGCIIGLNIAGTSDQGNNLSGIFITNAPNNRIGGTSAAQRNLISGNNQNGVLIQALGASGNVVLGNLIGLNATGGVAVANNANGIYFFGAPSNTVGGTLPGAGNVISGNSQSGVRLEGTNAFANVIAGNVIGLDPAGLVDLGNNQQGVAVVNAVTNLIGGTTLAARNIISGNNQTGVRLDSASARGNRIIGNFIGTDASGQLARGNTFEGVNAQNNASFNSIGGTSVGEANLIAFNGGDGVFLPNGTNNAVRANAIHSNAGLGIDLGSDGKQANDAGDADTGANQLQNYPLLTAATNTPGGLMVFGSLNSRPNGVYALDFYSSSLCDPSTNGEGQVYLGALAVTTGADSNATFNVTLPAAAGRFIAATATATNGNTSEFSTCVRAESLLPPATFAVLNTNDAGAGSLRQAILDNNLAVRNGRNTITFAISGAGPLVISPASQLPSPTEPVAIDGYTQSGAGVNTLTNGNNAVIRIRLDGAGAGNGADGLRLTSTGLVVRGLAITRFNGDGIEISTNGLNAVEGCFIGLDTDGTNVLGNGAHGIHINATANNVIGGAAPALRNVISGNSQNGVHVTGGGATNNFIAGNFIGTDRTGAVDLGNNSDGVNLNNAPFNLVGSLASGTGNLISGNNNDGIDLNGAGATNNTVLGNTIGSDVTGTLALGNNQNGVAINSNARFNRVGVNVGGGANVISFNGNIGVAVNSGTNNAIQANRVFGNGAVGIDLAGNGPTANDAGDTDTGPNQLQNFPVITSGTIHPANIMVAGTLNSRPNSSYVLDFFANLACDASGNGEGQQHFGSAGVTTDGLGNASFSVTPPGAPVGRYLTATATDTNGNTSEFSTCFAAGSTLPSVTLLVTNANDSGPGSLRQALLDAGNFPSGSANIIAFAISGDGPHTIAPLTPLPTPVEPVFIDGYTQPGSSPNTLSNGNNAVIKIRLDGASVSGFGADGLRLRAGNSTVRGLVLLRWNSSDAIEITQGGGNRVAGCFLGIDLDGSDKRNGQSIFISSAGNEIGGLTPAERNVIAYSFGDAIRISGPLASNNVVRGNFLGTDFTGTLKRGNLIAGVTIADATNNLVGGTEPGARNIISGNQTGLTVSGNSGGNVVAGNFIGTDVTGTMDLGNVSGGVTVSGGSGHVIGGASAAARNIISGNDNAGVSIFNASGVSVIGNWIGVSAAGAALSNNAFGVQVAGNSNRVGGVLAGEGNIIAFNGDLGVSIPVGTGNSIRGNAIYDNRTRSAFRPGLGLDLGEDGVTANDAGDGDAGPNNRQNFAIVTHAFSSGASTTIQGSLNSVASQTYQLDFFANPVCDSSDHGEGQHYLGFTSTTTDGGGNGSFNVTLPVGALGRFITATATDAQGNTSEFSPCYEAMLSTPPMTFTVTTTNDAGPGSLRQAIIDSNGHVSSQNNTIAFDIPGSGVRVIRLTSALPAFVQPVTIDGFTQTGAGANSLPDGNNAVHLIEVNGGAAGISGPIPTGLSLNLANLEVKGLRIVAFSRYGIDCVSSNGVIAGNLIYSNGFAGVRIPDGRGYLIGGSPVGDRNVISANNGGYGVEITGSNARANRVLGSFIGTDPTGVMGWGGQESAVSVWLGSGNQIGGTNTGEGNVMAFHASTGFRLQSGTNNAVRGNRIFGNGGLGIDLEGIGLTPNDAGDGDEGANHLQNFPILTNAVANVGSTVIQGLLNSRPNTAYSLDFYASQACGIGSSRQGEFYLGSAGVTTDGNGDVLFGITLPVTAPRVVLTATATDPAGNTSEFSPCQGATVNLPGETFTVTTTADAGPGSLRQAMLDVSLRGNTTPDRIVFNIPGPGSKVIQPLTSLPSPAESFIIDGTTQPAGGFAAAAGTGLPIVNLDGEIIGFGPGLNVISDGSTVQGLGITRFPGAGIVLSADNVTIRGNRIGVDPSGAAAGNGGGILIQGSNNTIGGSTLGAGNVISGNEGNGILLVGGNANNNLIQGNRIGTDAGGGILLLNEDNGIFLVDAPNNTIGGTSPGSGNIISGSGADGIRLQGSSCSGNQIQGNFIGTNPNEGLNLGNLQNGVLITSGAHDNTIGGFGEAMGNTIANNLLNGVRIDSGNRNGVLGNTFFNTAGKLISVAAGANANVQPPTLDVGYRNASGGITVEGRITGTPNTLYQVEVFQKNLGTPPGGGFSGTPGYTDTFGTILVTTDQFGNATFAQSFQRELVFDPNSAGLEATLTCDNNTSEMSQTVLLGYFTDVNLVLDATVNDPIMPGSNAVVTILINNKGPANATSVVVDSFKPPGCSYLGANNPHGTTSVVNDRVRCEIGSLAAGQSKGLTVTWRTQNAGLYQAYTEVIPLAANEGDNTDNHSFPFFYVLPTATSADLAASIQLDASSVEHGKPHQATVMVRNFGPATANGVSTFVHLPNQTSLKSAIPTKGTHSEQPGGLNWEISSLASGEAATLALVLTSFVDPVINTLQLISATAAAGGPSDPQLANNVDSTAFAVNPPVPEVTFENGNVQIAFPLTAEPFHLESAGSLLLPVTFNPVPSSLITTSGQFFVFITDPSTNPANAFFRLAIPAPTSSVPTLEFYQLNLNLDNFPHPFSEWGAVDLRFTGQKELRYFNLNVDNNWVLKNIPVGSPKGTGVVQEVRMSFPLTASYGLPKNLANIGYDFGTNTQLSMPPATSNVVVAPYPTEQGSGIADEPLVYRAPQPMTGGQSVSNVASKPGFPNRPQGKNECAPAGVLNSLEYLNQVFSMNLSTQVLNMATIKDAIGWTPTGAPAGGLWVNSWVDNKIEYMAANNIPIETVETTDPKVAMDALSKNHDVELRVNGHVACVVAITDIGSDDYALTLSHDFFQGEDDFGELTEIVILDTDSGTVYGDGWSPDFREFVIERPKTP